MQNPMSNLAFKKFYNEILDIYSLYIGAIRIIYKLVNDNLVFSVNSTGDKIKTNNI